MSEHHSEPGGFGDPEDGDPAFADDVLARTGLYSESVLLGEDHGRVPTREAVVTFVRPLVYRLPGPAYQGAPVDLLLCFPWDLGPLAGGQAYARAQLSIRFDREDIRAVALSPGPGTALGDGTAVTVRHGGGHAPTWVFQAPKDGLRPDGHWVQIQARVPADCAEFTGGIEAGVEIRRRLMGALVRKGAKSEGRVDFSVVVADAWPAAASPALRLPYELGPALAVGDAYGDVAAAGAGVRTPDPDAFEEAEDRRYAALPWLRRLMLAVDVERYSRRSGSQMGRVQRDLSRAVRAACLASEIDWTTCGRQASGDGYLLVLPAGVDEPATVTALLSGLARALHAANTTPERPADLLPTRIRASLHQGLIREGHNGYLGVAVIDLFRVLDSAPLRTTLDESRHCDLAVAWSESLYHDLVPYAFPGLDERHFRPVVVEMPQKDFTAKAWIQLRPRREISANPH